ncbi:MAG: DUF1573 domain-containing protein [Chitinophagales bacterium]|nr:DUF1573 domain-containing protein [Chitinophagales bacterium]
MNESIKTFSLVVITICVFIMTVIDILEMIDQRNERLAVPATTSVHGISAPDNSVTANQPRTLIKFDEMKYDFGDITEGEVVHHTFNFTNTGTNPLVISNAIGSCGCTVPTYPREPIAPGTKATIEVQFNSSGREGLQNKTITVTANTEPNPTVLTITANVNKKP